MLSAKICWEGVGEIFLIINFCGSNIEGIREELGSELSLVAEGLDFISLSTDGYDAERILDLSLRFELDYSVLRDDFDVGDLRVIFSDMDSTLIDIECMDEVAVAYGVGGRIARMTERSMAGEWDFVTSFSERLKLLEGVDVNLLEEIYNDKIRLNTGVLEFISDERIKNLEFYILSGGFTYFAQRLVDKYHLTSCLANEIEIVDSKMTGRFIGKVVDGDSKRDFLVSHSRKIGINRSMAIGDGANDIPMLNEAFIAVAFHPKAVVRRFLLDRLNFVQINFGGMDLILKLIQSR